MNFSHATIVGRLVRDPSLKEIKAGTKVCNFTVACDTGFGDNKAPMFLDCKAWNKLAEVIDQHFDKGKPILVSGELQMETWEGNDGGKRSKHVLNVSDFTFVGGKDGDGGGSPSFDMSPKKPATADTGGHADIPF